MNNAQKHNLLGCPCEAIDSIETAHQLLTVLVNKGAYGYSIAINAEKIMRYKSDTALREAIEQSSLPYPDGAGAVIALKWLYGKKGVKVDMPKAALDMANENKWRLFVLGAEEESNRIAFDVIKKQYPDIELVGRLNGYENEESIVQSIGLASPQLVLVGMGSPKQELFCCRFKKMRIPTFMIGCGGALDVLAGRAKRAPAFMINNNLEWFYRLCKQPSRWRRQLKLVTFLFHLIIERFSGRLSSDAFNTSSK